MSILTLIALIAFLLVGLLVLIQRKGGSILAKIKPLAVIKEKTTIITEEPPPGDLPRAIDTPIIAHTESHTEYSTVTYGDASHILDLPIEKKE